MLYLKKAVLVPVLFLSLLSLAQQPLKLREQPVSLPGNIHFKLKIPEGYMISVAASGLERPRFFAKSPDGRLFITDMHDRSDNRKGRVLIPGQWNSRSKTFESTTTYLDSLHNPNQVAFYTLDGRHYIYVAETGKLTRYDYAPGANQPSNPLLVATFPDYGLSYKYGGWHLTRSIDFHNGKLYVSVGSSCDACIETEEIRATIVEMDLNGDNKRIYARGLRNAVGMRWVNDSLWVSNMGRDNRGPDKPEDLFHTVIRDGFYGWPYYMQFRRQLFIDPAFKDSARPAFARKPAIARWAFKAHSAPLGFDYFEGFADPVFNKSFLVALHGSTSVWRQRGNAVVQLLPNGSYRDVVTGFLQGKTEAARFGRPCDVFQWDERSFFISDDKNGVIYYLWKETAGQ